MWFSNHMEFFAIWRVLLPGRNLDHGSYSHYCETEDSFFVDYFYEELNLFLWFSNHMEFFAIWRVLLPGRNLDHGSYSHYCETEDSFFVDYFYEELNLFLWFSNHMEFFAIWRVLLPGRNLDHGSYSHPPSRSYKASFFFIIKPCSIHGSEQFQILIFS